VDEGLVDFWLLYQIAVKDERHIEFAREWKRAGRKFPNDFFPNLICRQCRRQFRDQFRELIPLCLYCEPMKHGETTEEYRARLVAMEQEVTK
jgi:hypothetical protein